MRIFDPRLAERLDRGIELDLTRSVSRRSAAPALLGRVPAQPLALSNVPLRVLETRIPEGWPHARRMIPTSTTATSYACSPLTVAGFRGTTSS